MRSGLDNKMIIDFWRTSWDGRRWVQGREYKNVGFSIGGFETFDFASAVLVS